MGRENVENWSVRKCAKECSKCGEEFKDKQTLSSKLTFEEGQYQRLDLCAKCWDEKEPGLSSWKTTFIVPPPPREEAVKKENAESLLRRLLAMENEEDQSAIFILTVMLERKKLLVERDVKTTEDGLKLRVYEHKKTNESFMVVDPELKLTELADVQERVVALLSGQQPAETDATIPSRNASTGSSKRRPKLWKRQRYSTRWCC